MDDESIGWGWRHREGGREGGALRCLGDDGLCDVLILRFFYE